MIITDCNCGKKLNCGCTLSFSSYVATSISVLDVGTLSGGSCSFAQYVIDWFRDGVFYMTSGVGSDNDIQAYHPFTGTAAIPVAHGTYVPVLRYAILTGQTTKIFPSKKSCHDWCSFSGTLPTINVSSIYCGLVGIGSNTPTSPYHFKLNYATTQDYSLAARKFMFLLDEQAGFFAYQFAPASVYDQIKIYFKDETTPLWDITAGTENRTAINMWTSPFKLYSSSYKHVFRLPAYQPGDYLTIEVYPSVISGNVNTTWVLDMVCLPLTFTQELTRFNDDHRIYDADSWNLSYDAVLCRFNLKFKLGGPLPTTSGTNLQKYSGMAEFGFGLNTYNNNTFEVTCGMNYKKGTSGTGAAISGYSTQIQSYGMVTINKTGTLYTYSFADILDYNDYKTGYDYMMASAWFTSYSPDNTLFTHYKYFSYIFKSTGVLGCGDSETSIPFIFHPMSTVVFDAINKTIQITPWCPSNGMTSGLPCDDTYNQINSIVTSLIYYRDRSDYTAYSYCRPKYPLGYGASVQAMLPSVSALFGKHYYTPFKYATYDPMLCTQGNVYSNQRYGFTYFYFSLIIKSTRDAQGNWLSDPLLNYEVYMRLNKLNGDNTGNTLIYKLVDGVVTVKILWSEI